LSPAPHAEPHELGFGSGFLSSPAPQAEPHPPLTANEALPELK